MDRSHVRSSSLPAKGWKEVGLKVESVYRDEQSRWIVAIAESRDKRAFKKLFNYFAPRIKGFCQNNGSTADRADEVVQEAFVNVWRKANLFDPKKASAGAWIFAIARNSRIDLIRKENRPEADTTDPFFEQNEPENPLAVLETERKTRVIRDFVRLLPAEQQEVLNLAFFEEKPHSEVAEQLGIPLGTVKSRIRLAFKRIRSEFGEI
jgi:RNA polymerase sigma-70 factor (ECF subfamily)